MTWSGFLLIWEFLRIVGDAGVLKKQSRKKWMLINASLLWTWPQFLCFTVPKVIYFKTATNICAQTLCFKFFYVSIMEVAIKSSCHNFGLHCFLCVKAMLFVSHQQPCHCSCTVVAVNYNTFFLTSLRLLGNYTR